MSDIKVISFDADDTLWHNEGYFLEADDRFLKLVEKFLPAHASSAELMRTEFQNISLYGYGIKAYILSMVEAAILVTEGDIDAKGIQGIIDIGKDMLNQPVVLIDGVDEVLESLKDQYRMVMTTKGDLLDQERKLVKSGLEGYFHHIEIVSEKNEKGYSKLLRHLDVQPAEFLMIGNSLKSDVLPVLNIGSHAYHVPYHTTWAHEQIDTEIKHARFRELSKITDLLRYV